MQSMTDTDTRELSSRRSRVSQIIRVTAAAILAAGASAAFAGTATFDFSTDPSTIQNLTIAGNNPVPWQGSGGNPGGFLALTYPENSQNTTIVFPDIDNGTLVKAFKFECDLRVGNSVGDRAADGFSISFARGNDPILADPANVNNFAVAGGPENGTSTGISVSFDTWQGNTLPDGLDFPASDPAGGIIVRVDNVTVTRVQLPTYHGACNDTTSLQTGPRNAQYWADGGDPEAPESWAQLCWQPFSINLDDAGKLTVTYKGNKILDNYQTTYFPSVGRIVLAARTGGANENTHIDNIKITTVPADQPIVGIPQGSSCGFTVQVADAGTISPNQSTFSVKLNGNNVTPSISRTAPNTTLTIDTPTFLAAGSTNPVTISFTTSSGATVSATRNYVVPASLTIPATAKAATFDGNSSGFKVRTHWLGDDIGRGPGDVNTIENAETQLAGRFVDATGAALANTADLTGADTAGFVTVPTVNWEQNAGDIDANNPDNFNSVEPTASPKPNDQIPGISPSDASNIAAEILTFLDLKRGCYTFGVNSDDGFLLTVGNSQYGPVIGSFNGGRGASDTLMRVVVEADGVYPVRLSWWEGGGGANVEFFTVTPSGEKILVNDRSNPNAVKAYSTGTTTGSLKDFGVTRSNRGPSGTSKVMATFVNGSTSVDNASIKLLIDNKQVSVTPTTAGGVTSLSYTPTTPFSPGTTHTNTLVYSIGGVNRTNTSVFTVNVDGFFIEAEHFNYGSGQMKDAVNTMPYEGGEYDGLSAVHDVDYHQPDNTPDSDLYRLTESPNVPMDSQTGAGTLDVTRGSWDVTTNYKIGWGGGDWYNYTRKLTNGNYRIIGAQSHGDPLGTADRLVARFGVVTSGATTTSQNVVMVGSYSAPSSGAWGDNNLTVAKSGGQDAIVHLSGTNTIRVFIDSGDYDWFVLAPTTDPTPEPSVTSTSPANGSTSLATALSLDITDAFREKTVTQSTIALKVNGQTVTPTITKTAGGYNVKYTPASGFATGPVNYSLTFGNSGGTTATNNGSFNATGSGGFVIEAEDFNYGGGQTKAAASTMPLQQGLYTGLIGTPEVDYHVIGDVTDAGSSNYRTNVNPHVPMNENSGAESNRGSFTVTPNYKIGWIDSGEWFNYTRTFPSNNYSVFAAISHGDQGPTSGSLQLVGGNVATTNQTLTELGTFNVAGGTGGWGANRLVPLTDASGNATTVALGGTQTVRFTAGSGDYDYLLFVPGATAAGPRLSVTRSGGQITITWSGGGTLQSTDNLGSGAVWTDAGTGGSVTVTPSAAHKFYRVKI